MSLAAATVLADATDVFVVIGWSVLIAILSVAMFGVVVWLKRWVRSGSDLPPTGFTLGELRSLHKQGRMTDEEFNKAKSLIVEASRRESNQEAAAKTAAQTPGNQTKPKGW